ncbi:phospholipid-binding lipoprotein MlaA [Meinhardsimonia xiamenensis]|jgi:phospholipid-binding lipoprotein MlaA|uniref:Phospholipid-binding lipoprotein MlaA n=1 Tax=Meinhardsimonia xiamenensis TaxID=990712 RepID=A0A1G8XXQ4_9RHOB|nr:VacJ family lipoprotein [Meinhardsimonia xiamenensis]PRX37073.1 phospholipid-binding lipoprotein MlaA [Meinhardsimonia xiamenensis]SDJ94944.1 phospholipid-binding lipoprotein MlaA [Meinhardsimonia xiamenensis]
MRLAWPARWVVVVAAVLLAGCARGPDVAQGLNDPYEERNRRVHEANLKLDRAFLKPVAEGYTQLPQPVRRTLGNVAGFLALPRSIVNDVLQLRLDDAAHNSMRLLVNATFGLGGLLDPATEMGLEHRATDFGVTLGVWGVPEGNFVMHPLIGPSTERDTVGMVVDLALDPLAWAVPDEYPYIVLGAKAAAALGQRSAYGETVDAFLYGSADSYAQARLIYLENRRFEIRGRKVLGEEEQDPYAELFELPYAE